MLGIQSSEDDKKTTDIHLNDSQQHHGVQSINVSQNWFNNRIRYLYEEHLCHRTSSEPEFVVSEIAQYFGTRPHSWMIPLSNRGSYNSVAPPPLDIVLEEESEANGSGEKSSECDRCRQPLSGIRMKYLYENHWYIAMTDGVGKYHFSGKANKH